MSAGVPMSCSICLCPILSGTAFIGTGTGRMENGGSFAHAECYHRREEGKEALAANDKAAARKARIAEYGEELVRFAAECLPALLSQAESLGGLSDESPSGRLAAAASEAWNRYYRIKALVASINGEDQP